MGYKNLITYQQAEEIQDLTEEFCQRFYPGREYLRQRDQMNQAARSHKQNIAEGYTFKSTKSYIKLLGVSCGSGKELLEDYKDYARQKGIEVWQKGDRRLEGMRRGRWERRERRARGARGERRERGVRGVRRERGVREERGEDGRWRLPLTPSNSSDPSYPVNYMIDLLTRNNYLLERQIKSLEEKFIKQGGYTENLFKRRLRERGREGQVRLAYILVAGIIVLIGIVIGVNSLNKKGAQTKTYKSKVSNFKVNVPSGWQVQEDVLGNVTLTQQRGEGKDGQCMINIAEPRKIAKDVDLEKWVRTYLSQRDERFDYDLEQIDFKGYEKGVKIYIKNNIYQGQSWYFLKKEDQVFVFKAWKYQEGEGNCEDWLRRIVE
ncbi:hypothetical protein DRN85_09745 [Methanosarcinales archaeon]|nr:MAG: hypothetical protein DRN85_09745 [Methanosarcinales archaeon]